MYKVMRFIPAMILAGAVFVSCGARAQEEACDPQIWESIEAKALLEAHYENVVNESQIFKPDSVFEYSCFDMYVVYTGAVVGPVFSENQSWGPVPGHDPQSLDNALYASVLESLVTYLAQNFDHTFLGGRDESGITNDGSCQVMYEVWNAAKCRNFLQDDSDAFFSFDELSSVEEIRLLPERCDNAPDWEDMIEIAYDDPPWWQEYQTPITETYVTVDWLLEPNTCSQPVARGHVIVETFPNGAFPDAICTNPGCIYNGETCIPDGY